MAHHLPRMCEALSSIPSITQTHTNNNNQEQETANKLYFYTPLICKQTEVRAWTVPQNGDSAQMGCWEHSGGAHKAIIKGTN